MNHRLSSSELEIKIYSEADEFWSYAGNKKNQRRTWCAVERQSGIMAGGRTGAVPA